MTYTQEEQAMMDKGRTMAQATADQGGYFQVGNVQFPQAISAEHAVKLYHSHWPYNGEPIRKMRNWIFRIESYDPHTIASYVWG